MLASEMHVETADERLDVLVSPYGTQRVSYRSIAQPDMSIASTINQNILLQTL